MQYKPKTTPEGINSSKEHPLYDAAFLVALTAGLLLVLYFVLGFFTEMVVKEISLETEAQYFQGQAKINSSEQEKYLQNLVDKLWRHHPESQNVQLRASVNQSKELNAFMMVGGNMAVTQGLLSELKSENEVAFVICHEIGHFYNRDVLNSMGRQLGLSFILAAAGLHDSLIGSGASSLNLAFSRRQEQRADEFALKCLHNQYGHVQGYDSFFGSILKKEQRLPELGQKILSFSQTHPMTTDRLKNLKQEIQDLGFPTKGALTPLKISKD